MLTPDMLALARLPHWNSLPVSGQTVTQWDRPAGMVRAAVTMKYAEYFFSSLLALMIAFVPLPLKKGRATEQLFQLHAEDFTFQPAVLEVNPGDEVTIELHSNDVVHGLYLDGYDLEIMAEPGQSQRITFTADKEGTFRFRCSMTCGALHPFMIGKLRVGGSILFWRGILLSLLAILLGIRWSIRPHRQLTLEG